MTSRRETKMGDQVIFISYPLKFDLVKVTINRHQIRTGVPIAPDYHMNVPLDALFQNCINDSAPSNTRATRAPDKNFF